MHHAAATAFAVVLAIVSPPAAAVAQADCLDQSYLPAPQTNGLEVTANQPVTQTFTVGMTGQLTRVEIAQIDHHRGTPAAPLQVDVVTCDPSGTPTTVALASLTLQPAQVPATRGPLQLDLRPFNVQVAAGQVLGLALSSTVVPGTQTYGWWGEAPGGSYAGGQVFIQRTIALSAWDLAFQTWVAPPASSANYGQGWPGTNGVPTLDLSAPPVLGTAPHLVVGGYAANVTLGALWFGVQRASQATPFGGTALVQPLDSVLLFLTPGTTTRAFPVPGDPRFCNAVVDLQVVTLDTGASHSLAFTPGLELVVGF